jgi:hypothetical protein
MHTPELDLHSVLNSTLASNSQPCSVHSKQISVNNNMPTSELLIVTSGSLTSQCSVMADHQDVQSPETKSPVFDRRNFVSTFSSDAAVDNHHSELFPLNQSSVETVMNQANLQTLEELRLSTTSESNVDVRVTEAEQTDLASCHNTVCSLPVVVPVVYVNSNGKPTNCGLFHPVPSTSDFNKSMQMEGIYGEYRYNSVLI